jgi:hypothetical protein
MLINYNLQNLDSYFRLVNFVSAFDIDGHQGNKIIVH